MAAAEAAAVVPAVPHTVMHGPAARVAPLPGGQGLPEVVAAAECEDRVTLRIHCIRLILFPAAVLLCYRNTIFRGRIHDCSPGEAPYPSLPKGRAARE